MNSAFIPLKKKSGDLLIRCKRILDPVNNIDIEDGIILIIKGKFAYIGKNTDFILPESLYSREINEINIPDYTATPGFFDFHTHIREPGFTKKGSCNSESRAALKGGFTHITAMPNTDPAPDSVESLNFIRQILTGNNNCHISICCSASIKRTGKTLVNLEELAESGCRVFSDDGDCLDDDSLVSELLKISERMKFIFSDHCENIHLSKKAPVNLGRVSRELKTEGQPCSAETIPASRGILRSSETGGHYHIQHVSSMETVKLVRSGKRNSVNVTCEVTPHHLALNENAVLSKLNAAKCAPPLRTEEDRKALIAGFMDGTIDIIATDHAPHDDESKSCPLESASFGIAGLESTFGVLGNLIEKKELTLERVIHGLTAGRKLAGFSGGFIPGENADITVVDPSLKWIFTGNSESKGKNNPFTGEQLTGKVIYTIINGNIEYDSSI
ncbi:MAG: dihydroorotase [Deltaproteobacteria bacterium]|nr:dihydroorotase [Deltaproteobacteria bacterium]